MKSLSSFVIVLTLALSGAGPVQAAEQLPTLPPAINRKISFEKEIKPLLEASCIKCHAKGQDKGGLSLETRTAFLKGGDSGPAAIPGNSAQSLVTKLVAGLDPDSVMPKKGTKWTAEQVGLLRAWIDQGAEWPGAISFAKPAPQNLVPHEVVLPRGTATHPLDRLVEAYFAEKGIAAPAVVEDRIFARRVYLDTIGLLPTPSQLNSFLADASPDKRLKLVRSLLADRRGYADHWLTFWNDLLRNDYRGTGFIDGGRRQITGWLYAALVNNLPYDQFVAQLISPSKINEGFSRGIIWRGTVNASMLPPMQAAQNVAQVFMGVNLKCASCHDSFINDWALADSYGLAAVFSDDPLELVHCDKPTGKLASVRFLYPQLGSIDEKVGRSERMKQLSQVITDRKNGRLARTIVNRLWARLTGRGLVEPLDDMEQPAWNSAILDWLAEDLVANGYDLKRTLELILTSKAYQLPTVEGVAEKGTFVFRGPLTRRITAEQFCDALSSLSGEWGRMPSTLDIDFTTGGLIGPVAMPKWMWTNETFDDSRPRLKRQKEAAEAKRLEALKKKEEEYQKKKEELIAKGEEGKAELEKLEAARKKGEAKPDPEVEAAKKRLSPDRHKVVFRKTFTLSKLPDEAYAAAAASQVFTIVVNGRLVGPAMSDGQRAGRIQLFNVKSALVVGENSIALDVASHTDKGGLTEQEQDQYPLSRNHLNAISGVAFYLRATSAGSSPIELISDASWRTRRAPDEGWNKAKYDDTIWANATTLADGVTPIDEAPALPPVRRKDYANERIELGTQLRPVVATAAQSGHIRASLLTADPLMVALDRPNREVVIPARLTAATTLQALELTNGDSLDARLKRAAAKLAPLAAKNPDAWIDQLFKQALSRPPTSLEKSLSIQMIGQPVKPEGVADLLWSLSLLPEFQFIN